MSNHSNLALRPTDVGLSTYLSEINRFPLLNPDEEYMLAKRWSDDRDSGAAHRLVTSHLRLAAKIALGYRGYGLPVADVISEANIGLMQAVKRFDADKGFRLATYAIWWIRASVQEFILRSWSLVKIGSTRSQKKLFFNLRKAKARIGVIDDSEMTLSDYNQLSELLGLPEGEIRNMNERLAGRDTSLNAPVRNDVDGSAEQMELLVDESADHAGDYADAQEARVKSELLKESLEVLNDRERDVFESRKLSDTPSTLEVLAQKYGVSRERIRQIELRAFERVKSRMLNLASEKGMASPAS